MYHEMLEHLCDACVMLKLWSYSYIYTDIYFWCKVNIWNVDCSWETAFIFGTRTDVLVKASKFLRKKISRPEGDSKPPNFEFMPNALIIWTLRARHLCPMFLDTGFGGIVFETENFLTWQGLEPSTFGFMANALSIYLLNRYLISYSDMEFNSFGPETEISKQRSISWLLIS